MTILLAVAALGPAPGLDRVAAGSYDVVEQEAADLAIVLFDVLVTKLCHDIFERLDAPGAAHLDQPQHTVMRDDYHTVGEGARHLRMKEGFERLPRLAIR